MSGRMQGVPNSDYMADPFPGIGWTGNPAPGSVPSRTPPPDRAVPEGDTGVPSGTIVPLADQAIDGRGTSTSQPGQNDLGLAGASEDPGYTDSGAGHGEAIIDESFRYSWQSQPQRNG